MPTVDMAQPQQTKWWTNKEGKAVDKLIEVAELLLERRNLPWEQFYLTESHRGVPMLIVKGKEGWCSVSFMRRRGRFFRYFTNYVAGARALKNNHNNYGKVWNGKQQRHDFVEIELIVKFIEDQAKERIQ